MAALIVALVGCTQANGTSPPPVPTAATTTTEPPALVETTLPAGGCMLGEPALTEASGELSISLQEGEIDARHVSSWSLTSDEGCERFTVLLATEGGAPARLAGEVRAFLLPTEGVLRILLDPEVETSALVDQLFEGAFVSGAFVVRSDEGPLFVDIHLAAPSAVRVFVDRSPATITVDLARGEEPIGSPAVGDQVVIVQPGGLSQSYPLEVHGYARVASVEAQVRSGQTGSEIVESQTSSGDGIWGEYELVVPIGPVGTVSLVVDGSGGAASKVVDIS